MEAGYQVNWYGGEVGDVPIARNQTTIVPPQLGTFYAEAFDPQNESCGVSARVPVSVLLTEGVALENCNAAPVTIAGGNNGSIGLRFSGMGPFQIAWSGREEGRVETPEDTRQFEISGLTAGSYVIDITDVLGCTDQCIVEVTEQEIDPCVNAGIGLPQIVEETRSFCLGDPIPTYSVIPENGVVFNWLNAAGSQLANGTAQFTPPNPGIYYVEAERLSDGCFSNGRTFFEVLPSVNARNCPRPICLCGRQC